MRKIDERFEMLLAQAIASQAAVRQYQADLARLEAAMDAYFQAAEESICTPMGGCTRRAIPVVTIHHVPRLIELLGPRLGEYLDGPRATQLLLDTLGNADDPLGKALREILRVSEATQYTYYPPVRVEFRAAPQ